MSRGNRAVVVGSIADLYRLDGCCEDRYISIFGISGDTMMGIIGIKTFGC